MGEMTKDEINTTLFDEVVALRELAYAPDGKEYRSMVFEEAAKRLPLQEEIELLRAAVKPFALIGLDVLRHHPGWANEVFVGEWCGYRITYTQFAAAAAVAIGAYGQADKTS